MWTRRAFLGATAADRLGHLGVGLFTLPKSLERDFDGTLRCRGHEHPGMPSQLDERRLGPPSGDR